MNKAIKAIISGNVQGVGFRYFAVREAELLGITGDVRNLYDGNVEVFAEGDELTVKKYLAILKDGPRFGHVRNIKIENHKPKDTYTGFSVKY